MELRRVLEGLNHLFPSGLVMDGPALVAVVLAALYLASVLLPALSKAVADLLTGYLKQRGWTLPLFLYILPLLAFLVTRHVFAAALMSLPALGAAFWAWRRWPRWRLRWQAVLQLGFLMLAAFTDDRVTAWQWNKVNDKLQVYVVLPYQPGQVLPYRPDDGDELKTLVSLSAATRNMLAALLEGVDKVRVLPPGFSEPADLNQWRQAKDAVQQVRREGLQTDVVLMNLASLTPTPDNSGYITILVVLQVPQKSSAATTFREILRFREEGSLGDFKFLLLRASLRILDAIEKEQGLGLDPEEKGKVLRKVLEDFRNLAEVSRAPDDVLRDTETLVLADNPSEAEVRALLGRFPIDRSSEMQGLTAARIQANLEKVIRNNIPVDAATSPQSETAVQEVGTAVPGKAGV